jgi:phosphatidylserine/phosphatidylglycerophosphate/cardiolipin synthase-like enzyme
VSGEVARERFVAALDEDRAETGAAIAVRDATSVGWLVDNAEAYRSLLAACRSARESIWITQLALDADCVAYLPAGEPRHAGESAQMRLSTALLAAANERRVDVRILLNASLLLDTATPLREHFALAGADAARLRIRGVSRFPQLLHAKMVIVDGAVAFLMGSPFVNGYWDDSSHEVTDARRPMRELGGRPLHDLSVRLTGEPVADLESTFTELWNGADEVSATDHTPMPARPAMALEHEGIRIVRTAPEPRHAHHPASRMEILDVLLDGIARARSLIYIEHQYLSARPVVAALAEALEREPALEIIVVMNQNPDVTAYRGWQKALLAESGLGSHPRVGLFCLWSAGACGAGERRPVTQIFVHSKVVSIDDRWAMVGSANLDGVSLHSYGDDFRGRLGRRVFRGVRNFDVAAVLDADADETMAERVLELRTALWREHLDHPDLDASTVPSGGWLAHWRARAAECVVALAAHDDLREQEPQLMVLPFSRMSTPARQLADVGVCIALASLSLRFNPSWSEVHLSPNWVRNMFA